MKSRGGSNASHMTRSLCRIVALVAACDALVAPRAVPAQAGDRKSPDKQAAVRELILRSDPEGLLAESGYAAYAEGLPEPYLACRGGG